jgi:hypothetical protein
MESVYETSGSKKKIQGHKIKGSVKFYGTMCPVSHFEVERAIRFAWKSKDRFEVEIPPSHEFQCAVWVFDTPEKLSAVEWRFRYFPKSHALLPDAYYKRMRETRQHGWIVAEYWIRLSSSSSSDDCSFLKETPVAPHDVVKMAQDCFIENLKVRNVYDGK